MTWVSHDDVATFMGLPGVPDGDDGQRLVDATNAAVAYVERIRSDLNVDDTFTPTKDVRVGTIMFAAHVYQQRSAPGGFAAWGDGMGDFAPSVLPSLVQRLIGVKRPVIG